MPSARLDSQISARTGNTSKVTTASTAARCARTWGTLCPRWCHTTLGSTVSRGSHVNCAMRSFREYFLHFYIIIFIAKGFVCFLLHFVFFYCLLYLCFLLSLKCFLLPFVYFLLHSVCFLLSLVCFFLHFVWSLLLLVCFLLSLESFLLPFVCFLLPIECFLSFYMFSLAF